MKIVVKKGLDIPIQGKAEGEIQTLKAPNQVAFSLDAFDDIRFKVHVKVGDSVKIGQPLVESKEISGQQFVSPAAGIVSDIRRGFKRRLLYIVIDLAQSETYEEHGALKGTSREEILDFFMRTGLFPHIRLRPFNLLPDPKWVPRDIFVTAIETRPFVPSYEMQVKGNEDYFQEGLNVLQKLTTGHVHLVFREGSSFAPFVEAKNVQIQSAQGPHPAGNSSVHIHKIAPIRKSDDYVWSLNAIDVVTIGKMALEGRYFTERVIAIAGNGVLAERRGFFAARMGYPVNDLIENRITNQPARLISGDPLTGMSVDQNGFLGFAHTTFTVIPENTTREPFHFFKAGLNKFSATRAYLTGFLNPPEEGYSFTTNQHGEERAFIDGSVYDTVMPMRIPTMQLIKSILAEDFELAEQLGLLEVVPEDFALPTFICPSKIEMIDIVKQGLDRYAKELGH